jgi:hypothetical protein
MTLSIKIFNIMVIIIKGLFVTLSINTTQCNDTMHNNALPYVLLYSVERRVLYIVMLNAVIQSVIMQGGIMLNDVLL